MNPRHAAHDHDADGADADARDLFDFESDQRSHATKRQRGRNGRRALIVIAVLVVLLGGLAAVGAVFWSEYGERISLALGWTSNDFEGSGHGEAMVTISSGEIGEDIAESLYEAGVVKTSEAFYELLLAQNPQVEFMPGLYQLKLEMSSQAALDALQDPENRHEFSAMIPEGKTLSEALVIISEGAGIPLEELQAAAADPAQFGVPAGVPSLEGWLYPATYEFEVDTTAVEALSKIVGYQVALLDELGVVPEDRERVLTVASIIEREAGQHADFGKVSRVIANRLDQGMLLQMDSTSQYGMSQHDDGSVWSSAEALADDNPWNTYVHAGLPVGPIANPGRLAIESALNPEPGDWLYFVAVNLDTGESVFTTNVDDHDRAVAQLNEWCAANPGRGC